jgi:hypothetical protein
MTGANQPETGAANQKAIRSIRYFLRDAAFAAPFERIFLIAHMKKFRGL